MTVGANGKARRLLVALADAAPAFTVPPRPVEGGFGRRLLIALSDTAPAFSPRVMVLHGSYESRQHEVQELGRRAQVDSPASQWPRLQVRRRTPEDISVPLGSFIPEEIDTAHIRADIETLSRRMAIGGHVDISVLDNLVNALVNQWIMSIRVQHASYVANTAYGRAEARALSAQNAAQLQHDQGQLEEADLALMNAQGRRARARAGRTYTNARRAFEMSRIQLMRAEANEQYYSAQLDAADRIAEAAADTRVALGEQLKQLARVEVATLFQDQSASDLSSSSGSTDGALSESDGPTVE